MILTLSLLVLASLLVAFVRKHEKPTPLESRPRLGITQPEDETYDWEWPAR